MAQNLKPQALQHHFHALVFLGPSQRSPLLNPPWKVNHSTSRSHNSLQVPPAPRCRVGRDRLPKWDPGACCSVWHWGAPINVEWILGNWCLSCPCRMNCEGKVGSAMSEQPLCRSAGGYQPTRTTCQLARSVTRQSPLETSRLCPCPWEGPAATTLRQGTLHRPSYFSSGILNSH